MTACKTTAGTDAERWGHPRVRTVVAVQALQDSKALLLALEAANDMEKAPRAAAVNTDACGCWSRGQVLCQRCDMLHKLPGTDPVQI